MDYLGLELILTPSHHLDIGYNGKGLIKATTYSNAIHEVAHYLCASRSRRRAKNYGLGHGPDDDFTLRTPTKVSMDHSVREEQEASLLGITIERHLGMKWGDTYDEHSWSDPYCGDGPDGLVLTFDSLEEKGLVTLHRSKRQYVPRVSKWVGRRRIR